MAAIAFLAAMALGAQNPPRRWPLGIFHAELRSIEGSPTGGWLGVRMDNGDEFSCRYDSRTFLERDRLKIPQSALRSGDRIEVVSEANSTRANCTARFINVIAKQPPKFTPGTSGWTITRATESFAPRGNLTFAGLVQELKGTLMTLRTRQEGTLTLRLRPDTKFIASGLAVRREDLQTQMRVFIRGDYSLFDGELEVFQVVWGDILPAR
jgi:hypothetical protein